MISWASVAYKAEQLLGTAPAENVPSYAFIVDIHTSFKEWSQKSAASV